MINLKFLTLALAMGITTSALSTGGFSKNDINNDILQAHHINEQTQDVPEVDLGNILSLKATKAASTVNTFNLAVTIAVGSGYDSNFYGFGSRADSDYTGEEIVPYVEAVFDYNGTTTTEIGYLNRGSIISPFIYAADDSKDVTVNVGFDNIQLGSELVSYKMKNFTSATMFRDGQAVINNENAGKFSWGKLNREDEDVNMTITSADGDKDSDIVYEFTSFKSTMEVDGKTKNNYQLVGTATKGNEVENITLQKFVKVVAEDGTVTYNEDPLLTAKFDDGKGLIMKSTTQIFGEEKEFVFGQGLTRKNYIYDKTYTASGTKSPTYLNLSIDDYVSIEPIAVSSFFGTTSVRFDVTINLTLEKYLDLAQKMYIIKNKEDADKVKGRIENGLSYLLVTMTLRAKHSGFSIINEDGETTISSPYVMTARLGKEAGVKSKLALFIDGNDIDMKDFSINSMTLNAAVYSTNADKIEVVTMSSTFHKYDLGFNDIKDANGSVIQEGSPINRINLDLINVIVVIAASLLTIIGAVALYFYLKEKNKNDEFKKMRTGEYIKNASVAFIFFNGLALMLFYLIMRITLFNNSPVVYNSMDALLIVFILVTLFSAAYFIRKFYVDTKATLEKKKREKLGMNKKTSDNDGTVHAGK